MHQFGLCLVLLAQQQLIAKWEGGRKLFVQNNVIGYRMELVTNYKIHSERDNVTEGQ